VSQCERLLDPRTIPKTLWSWASEVLFIPPSLAKAYETLIERYCLRDLSNSRNSQTAPVGGLTEDLTNQHFAQAFDGSVARTELAMLDPRQVATLASNALITSLAGSSVCLTDAPCGAGAAAFALLSTTAELRAREVFPRLPLDVFLIGAELSETARKYALSMLDELRTSLEEQAIFVSQQFLSWDVTDPLSNTDLIRSITINSARASHRLLVVANFNAFLERHGKRKAAQPQIEELFRHVSGPHSVAIWIEPNMNRATGQGGLFQWLKDLVSTRWKRFANQGNDPAAGDPMCASSALFTLPLRPSQTAVVRLAVMRINLFRADQ